MYKLLTALLAGALLSTHSYAAEDWDREQYNVIVSHGDYHFRYREYDGDNQDKVHYQVGKKTGKWQFQYQYWENKGKVEHRPRFDYTVVKFGAFSVVPRFEYRDIEDKDAYFRVMPQLKVKKSFGNLTPSLTVAPRFAFGREGTDDGELEDIMTDLRFAYKVNKTLTVEPGVRYIVDGEKDFGNKKNLYATLQVKIKL